MKPGARSVVLVALALSALTFDCNDDDPAGGGWEGSPGSTQGRGGSSQGAGGTSQGASGSTQGTAGTGQGASGAGGSGQGAGGSSQGAGGSTQGAGGTSQGAGGTSQGAGGSGGSGGACNLGAGGAVSIPPRDPPTPGTTCPTGAFSCNPAPGNAGAGGEGGGAQIYSKCVGGKWEASADNSPCAGYYGECNPSFIQDNTCCDRPVYCDFCDPAYPTPFSHAAVGVCDGTRWHVVAATCPSPELRATARPPRDRRATARPPRDRAREIAPRERRRVEPQGSPRAPLRA